MDAVPGEIFDAINDDITPAVHDAIMEYQKGREANALFGGLLPLVFDLHTQVKDMGVLALTDHVVVMRIVYHADQVGQIFASSKAIGDFPVVARFLTDGETWFLQAWAFEAK